METNQSAIVRSAADLRVLAQECKAIHDRIRRQDRDRLAEYRELGIRLNRAKEMVKRGEWEKWLEQYGIPSQRASEAMRVAEHWDQIPESGDLASFLTACKDIKLCSEKPPPPAVISTDADASEDDEPETPKAGKGTAPKPTPASPAAASEPPVTAANAPAEDATPELKDALDHPVPPGLAPVFQKATEFKDITKQLNAINRKLTELKESPAGVCLRLQPAQIDLKNLKETIRFDTPFCVCPVCEGIDKTRKANCPCKQRGWLIEGAYKNLPSEYRE